MPAGKLLSTNEITGSFDHQYIQQECIDILDSFIKIFTKKRQHLRLLFWLCGSRHAQPRPTLPRFAKDLIWQSWWHCEIEIKVALSPSKKVDFICFNDSLSKIMKNAFYFTLNIHLFTNFLFKLFIFCLTFLMMQENGLIRKLGIISKFMRSNV